MNHLEIPERYCYVGKNNIEDKINNKKIIILLHFDSWLLKVIQVPSVRIAIYKELFGVNRMQEMGIFSA